MIPAPVSFEQRPVRPLRRKVPHDIRFNTPVVASNLAMFCC